MAISDNTKLKQFLINTLRRASYRHPGRYLALKRAHIGRNQYQCELCQKVVPRKEISLDHIVPVVDPAKGWENLDVYAERMFVDETGYQSICDECHDKKTLGENEVRKATRASKKKTTKKAKK